MTKIIDSFGIKNKLTDRMYREVVFEEIYREELEVPLFTDIPDREVHRMYEAAEAIAQKQPQPPGARLCCISKLLSTGRKCQVYLYTWHWAYGL